MENEFLRPDQSARYRGTGTSLYQEMLISWINTIEKEARVGTIDFVESIDHSMVEWVDTRGRLGCFSRMCHEDLFKTISTEY
jgi:hypothetical protein